MTLRWTAELDYALIEARGVVPPLGPPVYKHSFANWPGVALMVSSVTGTPVTDVQCASRWPNLLRMLELDLTLVQARMRTLDEEAQRRISPPPVQPSWPGLLPKVRAKLSSPAERDVHHGR